MVHQLDHAQVSVREEERGFAAAAHLVGAIPLWGFVFLAVIWLWFKERSREIVFHVQQAMVFQMVFLTLGFFALVVQLLNLPIGVLHQGLAEFISRVNMFFLIACYTVYASICIWAAAATFLGKPFLYPVVGKKVLEGSLTKPSPEE